MKINDTLQVTIIDDNHLGNGIAKHDDKTIFIPQTVKGDIVNIKINKITKNIAFGDLISYEKKSSNHIKIKCPYYKECGGCDLLHVSYEREKEVKEEYIKKIFKDFNKHIISFDREHYRNKVILHVSNNKIGFYEKKTNKLIPIDNCLLLEEDINKLILILKEIDLSNIKSITIKNSDNGLLLSTEGHIKTNDLKELIKHKEIKSIYQNNKLIYGDEYLKISLKDIDYSINNNSFFQINKKCTESLYEKITQSCKNGNSLLDLYCGTGSIGIYVNKSVKTIKGIEINNDSVKCAKKNIENNNIKNYDIICDDASSIDKDYDIVIVDPPRKGLSKEVIDILNKMNTKKLIYVSCNPSTLKRDIDLLKEYHVKDIDIFNMFPSTNHIESLVVLERN